MFAISEGRILTSKEKSKKEYILKAAETISTTHGNNLGLIHRNTYAEDLELYGLAQGRATDSDLRTIGSFLGHSNNNNLTKLGFNNIPVQELNILPHYVNCIHGKAMSIDYVIGVEPIDRISLDEKKQRDQAMLAFVEFREKFASFGIYFDKIKEETGMEDLPSTYEDAQMLINMPYKDVYSIKATKEIESTFNANKWDLSLKAKIIMDLIVLNQSWARVFVDGYGVKQIEHVPKHKLITSYSEGEDFDKLTYAGILEAITFDQFVCEASNELSDKEILELFNAHKSSGNLISTFYDKEERILVFRFQFLEEDLYDEESEEAESDDEESEKEPKRTIQGKYGGTWVVASKTVYNHGLIQQGMNLSLDYIGFAPNMRFGRYSSIITQCRELSSMLSTAWTKYKEGIGNGYFGLLEIDQTKIAETINAKGGVTLDWIDKIAMLKQQGLLISAGNVDSANPNAKGISLTDSGLGAADFINTIKLCQELMAKITGVNELADGTTPAQNTLNGVMEMSNQNTNTNLSHYYRGYNSIFTRCALSILCLWKSESDPDLLLREYRINSRVGFTKQEWMEYNAKVANMAMIPLSEGGLSATDVLELSYPNIKDMTEAIWMCKQRVAKNKAKSAQEAQAIQAQRDQAMQAQIQQAHDNLIFAEGVKTDGKLKEIDAQGRVDYERQKLINEGLAISHSIRGQSDLEKTKQQGADSILKTATMNQSDQIIEQMKKDYDERMHGLEMTVKLLTEKDRNEAKSEKKDTP